MDVKKLLTLKKALLQFAEVVTDKGTLTIDGELAVGVDVYIGDEVAADGEYVLEDGRIVVVAEGKVSEIKEAEPAEPTEPAEPVANAEPTEPATEPTEPATEPAYDEKQAVINELTAKVADLEAELIEKENKITELEAKLAQLEKPVDEPLEMKAQPQPFTVKSSGALKYFE